MKADAIMRVTALLRKRLEAALALSGVSGTVFVGPLDDAEASGAALVLFLYRILPNANHRNSEHRLPSTIAPPTVYLNSIPLDLYFLVTVGTTSDENEERPLQYLGYAIQAIQAAPDLTGPDVDNETVHVTMEPLSTEEASRIWALFPTANYRTSVAYLASPVWVDPPDVLPLAEPVVDDRLHAGAKAAEVVS
ncbi:MAG TPA: DUF4255 domain-containing protein [Pyrinomonadaceae bacterium]|nr:DUF4255 domain-containing protein [Pyrinomonadaceae bacterium]